VCVFLREVYDLTNDNLYNDKVFIRIRIMVTKQDDNLDIYHLETL
jgi:hypothetical protein